MRCHFWSSVHPRACCETFEGYPYLSDWEICTLMPRRAEKQPAACKMDPLLNWAVGIRLVGR